MWCSVRSGNTSSVPTHPTFESVDKRTRVADEEAQPPTDPLMPAVRMDAQKIGGASKGEHEWNQGGNNRFPYIKWKFYFLKIKVEI